MSIKQLEDDIGENLDDLEFDSDFLDKTSKPQFTKEITEKLEFIKIENLTGGTAPVVEYLFGKCEALSSNPSTAKRKKG
jgi:hypothetical protein